jgi:hypothetical protein
VAGLCAAICDDRGWCDPIHYAEELRRVFASRGSEALLERIVQIEGFEAWAISTDDRRWLTSSINDWLIDTHGRGARSGLPL